MAERFEGNISTFAALQAAYLFAIPATDEQLDAEIAKAEAELDATPLGSKSKRFLFWRVDDQAQRRVWVDAHNRVFYLKMARNDRRKGQRDRAEKARQRDEELTAIGAAVARGMRPPA